MAPMPQECTLQVTYKRQTPAKGRARTSSAVQLILGSSGLASDAFDLEARNAEVIELTVREQRQLADGFAVTEVRLHLSEDVRNEHGELLRVGGHSAIACVLVLQGSRYACAMPKRRANAVDEPCDKGMKEKNNLQALDLRAYLSSRRLVDWNAERLG